MSVLSVSHLTRVIAICPRRSLSNVALRLIPHLSPWISQFVNQVWTLEEQTTNSTNNEEESEQGLKWPHVQLPSKNLGRMEEKENSLGKTLLCLEREPRVQPGLPAVFSALIMLIHKPSIILMSLFCGWPCFYFLEYKKGTKRISLQACQAHCSLFRGREWLNLHPQSHSWPTFSLEPENQGPGDDSQSSVSTVGSNLGSGSWVHVGPQLLGSNFRRKGKHAAD